MDEVGELPLAAQAKMLRTLQSGEVTIVGTSEPISVDVRVIAATNRDLRAEVARGAFREDLFYRLAVVTLHSPSLRERTSDIPGLVRHFVDVIAKEYGMSAKIVDADALRALECYPWPGNIRELRNVIERMMILCGSTISLTDLPPEISSCVSETKIQTTSSDPSGDIEPWHIFKQRSERAHLERALKLAEWNISEAARLLHVERQTIHKWLKSYGISR